MPTLRPSDDARNDGAAVGGRVPHGSHDLPVLEPHPRAVSAPADSGPDIYTASAARVQGGRAHTVSRFAVGLDSEAKLVRAAVMVVLSVGLIIALGASVWFGHSTEELARLGGFLAGTTGVLWASAGLLLVYLAFRGQRSQVAVQEEQLRLQYDELRRGQAELKQQQRALRQQLAASRRQQFESTLFALVERHHQVVAELRHYDGESWHKGPSALPQIARELVERFSRNARTMEVLAAARNAFAWACLQNRSDHRHYFNVLGVLLRFVRSAPPSRRADYATLVSSQLSVDEQVMVLFAAFHPATAATVDALLIDRTLLSGLAENDVLEPLYARVVSERPPVPSVN